MLLLWGFLVVFCFLLTIMITFRQVLCSSHFVLSRNPCLINAALCGHSGLKYNTHRHTDSHTPHTHTHTHTAELHTHTHTHTHRIEIHARARRHTQTRAHACTSHPLCQSSSISLLSFSPPSLFLSLAPPPRPPPAFFPPPPPLSLSLSLSLWCLHQQQQKRTHGTCWCGGAQGLSLRAS